MLVLPAAASAAGTLSIGEVSVQQGCTVQVPITITNAESVVSCGIDLLYDPAVVRVTGVADSDFDTLIPNIDNETGVATIGVAQLQGGPGVDSPFQVCNVTLQAIGSVDATSELGFSVRDNCTGEGNVDIPLNLDNGSLTVLPPPSTIVGPSGTLGSGQSGTFSVQVANLTDVSSLLIVTSYDTTYAAVTDIQVNAGLQDSVILYSGTGAHNGYFEHGEAYPTGWVYAYLSAPAGLTVSELTPIVDITFRTTDKAGTSETVVRSSSYGSGTIEYYGTDLIEVLQSGGDVEAAGYWDNQFDRTVNGTITASGGNIPAPRGTLYTPNGSVTVGNQKTLPLSAQDLGTIDNLMCSLEYNSSIVTFTNTENFSLSQTAAGAGVTLDFVELNEYGEYSSVWMLFGNMSELNTASLTSVADLTMQAVGEVGDETEFAAAYHMQKWYSPRENVSIYDPFASIVNGDVTIVPPSGKDLRGRLVDPPEYIKKYKNGSLIFDATMVIENIGTEAVTEDFTIRGELVGQNQTLDISDDIAPGANVTYYMHMSIDPSYSGDTIVGLRADGYKRYYTITTGGDLSVGDYGIGLGIDVNSDVEEINEENNYVTHQATITRPDLIPVYTATLVQGLPSSNTTILENAVPGTYTVTVGTKNIGNVDAIATTMEVSLDGINQTLTVPALGAGENWTTNLTGVELTRTPRNVAVEVNSDRAEAETNYENNTFQQTVQAFDPVTVILPNVIGSTTTAIPVEITLTNVPAPITAFSLPIKYDPSVCYVSSVVPNPWLGDIRATTAYGRVTLSGTDLDIQGDTTVATVYLKSRSDAGRSSVLDSQTDAYVRTTGGNYLELEITRGAFTQDNVTDARVNLQVPREGSVDYNQTISVSVWNAKTNPVVVDVNVTIDGNEIWSASDVPLGSYASRYFTINTWKPDTAGTYEVKTQITGDDQSTGNAATRNVVIQPFTLEITNNNRDRYERYYHYNKTPYLNEYFNVGTYYTANQPARPNATLTVWYANGTQVDLSQDSPFDLYYYYPATLQSYCYDSTWNSVSWYYIRPKVLGAFNYSINLEARGESDYINGSILVREPFLDIKVAESTLIFDAAGDTVSFDVFNRSPSQGRSVSVTLAAGAEGRTLNGLEQLTGYPHGCPEQTMSPALAILRVKQYYEQRGALTDAMNATFQQKMQDAIDRMSAPDGYNAQQLAGASYGDKSGGWAWGKNSQPSAFYTYYPNYVITELLNDDDPAYWGSAVAFTPGEIDLNASANWLIQRQQDDGHWAEYGYIYNQVEWTGAISDKLASEYPYLNATMQSTVNTTLNKSLDWLQNHNYNSENAQAVAHGIYGLVAIRDHGLGDADDINDTIAALQTNLLNQKETESVGSYYWGWGSEATGHAVLALNRSGLSADNETVAGGVRYLLGAKGSWGWGSTRTTAVVINTLTQVQPHATISFDVDAELRNGDGDVVWSETDVPFDNANFQYIYPLTADQVAALYDVASPNSTAQVVVSGKSDFGDPNEAKLFVEVKSIEQVPQSIAFATIPAEFIDPIATDFFLDVAIPNPGTLVEGAEADVEFTIENDGPNAVNQTTMIIEIPISSRVNFTGSATGSDTAYYLSGGSPVYINHMYNATTGKLYVYPGSDDESQPSVEAGASKTFYVPLSFEIYGNSTVEARAYPMYNDTWMAVDDGATYIKGYGNITLDAVDEDGDPVLADFYVGGASVAANTNTTTVERVEATYAVAIRNETSWVNTTITVTPGDTATYTAQFVSDTTLPHISQIVGASDSARVMPPTIEETISNESTNHWNAGVPAMQSFNASIASSGGIATIAVDIPTLNRTIGTAMVNDTISVRLHNASGWFPYTDFTIENGQLILNNVDTGDIDMIDLEFEGRRLGDTTGDGRIDTRDARDAAWNYADSSNYPLTFNQGFYSDVDDNGRIDTRDAKGMAWKYVGDYDNDYQTP